MKTFFNSSSLIFLTLSEKQIPIAIYISGVKPGVSKKKDKYLITMNDATNVIKMFFDLKAAL